MKDNSERLAKTIRSALGDFNDDKIPLILIIQSLVEKLKAKPELALVQKFDIDKPSLFVCKLKKEYPIEALVRIRESMNCAIEAASPGSKVLILGPEFEEIKVTGDKKDDE